MSLRTTFGTLSGTGTPWSCSGFDLSSVLVGHGTARLMELLDVGVVLEERILEHAENARAEDGGVVRASRFVTRVSSSSS